MYKDKQILANKYQELGSLNKVAEYFKVSKKTILNYMKKYDIPRNTPNKNKPKKPKKIDTYHKGYIITASGYKKVKAPQNHPKADCKGYIQEHVLVMETHIGRYLKENEVVHHVDKNKLNNSIENLQLMDKKEHTSMHSRQPRKDIDIEKACELIEEGYTYTQVCNYLKISESGLRKKLKKNGIDLKLKRGGARRKKYEDL